MQAHHVLLFALTFATGCGIEGLYMEIPPYEPRDLGVDAGANTEADMSPDMHDDADVATPIASLEPPQNVRATPSVDGVTLSWDSVRGATGYELSVDDSGWQEIGASTEYLDEDASLGTLAGALTVSASDATSPEHVSLEMEGEVQGIAGSEHRYRVRAKTANLLSEPSIELRAARGVGDVDYVWERTVIETGDFETVDGPFTTSYLDNKASSTGEKHSYRAVASAPWASNVVESSPEQGWRLAAIKVTTGYAHSCALLSNGKVKCWGWASYGQLGYESRSSIGGGVAEMPPPDVNVGKDVIDIVASDTSSCALTSENKIRCWGEGKYGALGRNDTMDVGKDPGTMPPVDIPLGQDIRTIRAGGRAFRDDRTIDTLTHDFYCAQSTTGEVYCWGSGLHGVLGSGSTDSVGRGQGEIPMPPLDLDVSSPLGIEAGSRNACVVDSNRTLKCWGRSYITPRADFADYVGAESDQMPPPTVKPELAQDVVAVDVGFEFACSIDTSNRVSCWGDNTYGQLSSGNAEHVPGSRIFSSYIDYTQGLAVDEVATDISTGMRHACVLTNQGSVLCWGEGHVADPNGVNHIGDEPGELPVLVDLGAKVSKLGESMGGNSYQCVIIDTGEVVCWGEQIHGQIGYEGKGSKVTSLDAKSLRIKLW